MTKMKYLLLCLFVATVGAADPLEELNIDSNTITVSGFSAGGDMTVQMHVAFSNTIKGAGVMSGSPYYCAQDSLTNALVNCMTSPIMINLNPLVAKTEEYGASGDIDPVENLALSRVYVYNGANDYTRFTGVAPKVEEYYIRMGVDKERGNIVLNTDLKANHGYPTVENGNACNTASSPYVNRCDWDGAYEMLNYLYFGNLLRPDRTEDWDPIGTLEEYDQREFFPLNNPSGSSFDTVGLVYIPDRCKPGEDQKQCKLHVVFHGCVQAREAVGTDFATLAGYNEVGDLNDIVMLYPQAVKTTLSNPNGCFDWWGYLNSNYATKSGAQMSAVRQMIERLASIDMS